MTTLLTMSEGAEALRVSRIAYTIPETAALLGVHRRTVEKKIKAGVLSVSRKLGTPLIPASSIHALFEPEK